MLSKSKIIELSKIVSENLDEAERHWEAGGYLLKSSGLEAAKHETFMDSVEPSQIPGYEWVKDGETVIDEFIAFVADMRGSSNHLMRAISDKRAKVSGLQRVFYETSALLPALGYVVKEENGGVTEYLGDGVLALFKVSQEDKAASIYAAHTAAKNAIGGARDIINQALKERYNLPEIDLGIGLSVSRTLITLVGLYPNKQPKAFGECVFKATKLSAGKNTIVACQNLKAIWPSSKEGTLRFQEIEYGETKGYAVTKKK